MSMPALLIRQVKMGNEYIYKINNNIRARYLSLPKTLPQNLPKPYLCAAKSHKGEHPFPEQFIFYDRHIEQ